MEDAQFRNSRHLKEEIKSTSSYFVDNGHLLLNQNSTGKLKCIAETGTISKKCFFTAFPQLSKNYHSYFANI